MNARYTSIASLTAVVFGLMIVSPASALDLAQAQEAQPAQGQTGTQAAPISDEKLQAFAVAYLEVDKVRQEYSAKIGATSDAAAKEKLQTEASQQMVKAVEASPISVQEYTTILTAAQNDPALAKKVEEKLQSSTSAQQ